MAMRLENSFALLANFDQEPDLPPATKEPPSPAVEKRLSRAKKAASTTLAERNNGKKKVRGKKDRNEGSTDRNEGSTEEPRVVGGRNKWLVLIKSLSIFLLFALFICVGYSATRGV